MLQREKRTKNSVLILIQLSFREKIKVLTSRNFLINISDTKADLDGITEKETSLLLTNVEFIIK